MLGMEGVLQLHDLQHPGPWLPTSCPFWEGGSGGGCVEDARCSGAPQRSVPSRKRWSCGSACQASSTQVSCARPARSLHHQILRAVRTRVSPPGTTRRALRRPRARRYGRRSRCRGATRRSRRRSDMERASVAGRCNFDWPEVICGKHPTAPCGSRADQMPATGAGLPLTTSSGRCARV